MSGGNEGTCRDLVGEQTDVDTDDVADALGLAVVVTYTREELRFLPDGEEYRDGEGLPIQMAYWSEESLMTPSATVNE